MNRKASPKSANKSGQPKASTSSKSKPTPAPIAHPKNDPKKPKRSSVSPKARQQVQSPTKLHTANAAVQEIIHDLEVAAASGGPATDPDSEKKMPLLTPLQLSAVSKSKILNDTADSKEPPVLIRLASTATLTDITHSELVEYTTEMVEFDFGSVQDFEKSPINFTNDIETPSGPSTSNLDLQEATTAEPVDDLMSIRTSKSYDDDNISVRTEDFISKDGEVKEDAILYSDDDQSMILGVPSTGTIASKIELQDDDDDDIELKDTSTGTRKLKNHKTNTDIYSYVLGSKNLKKMDWDNPFVALTLRKCLHSISNTKLTTIKSSLTCLKFSNLTSFKTVLLFLHHCKKLERLAFTNVQLVQKQDFTIPGRDQMLSLPKLKQLELTEWIYSLTKNEYWLLDYFYRNTNMPKLLSFTLRGSDSFQWERAARKAESRLREIDDPSIVLKFLIKYHSSLKKISLGGLGFQLVGNNSEISRFSAEMALADSVRTLRVPLNAPGIDLLLQHQKNLREFSCCGFLPHFGESFRDEIYACIDKNKDTLESVGIFPCVLQDNFKGYGVGVYDFTCSHFQACNRLRHLFLNVTTAHRAFTRRFSCGRILNVHMLPITLVSLEIYTHKLDLADLNDLAGRFNEFSYLQRLVISTNIKKFYHVRVDWIRSLFGLPNFHLADFFGGHLESKKDFEVHLKEQDGKGIVMNEIMDCVSFHRRALKPLGSFSDPDVKIGRKH